MACSTVAGSIDARALDADELAEPVEQRPGNLKPDSHPVGVAHVRERQLDLLAQVRRDPAGRLGRPQRTLAGQQPFGQLIELRL